MLKATDKKERSAKQTTQTKFVFNDKSDTYKGDEINTPTTCNTEGNMMAGFTVLVYGASGNNKSVYAEERLANESGDIMFVMEHNNESKAEKDNGNMTPEEYRNSRSATYSSKIEKTYRKRKHGNKKTKYLY